jgi:hypothetical protein
MAALIVPDRTAAGKIVFGIGAAHFTLENGPSLCNNNSKIARKLLGPHP